MLSVLLPFGLESAFAGGTAEEGGLPEDLRPQDAREDWRVGIAVFSGRDLSEAAASITETVPLLIRDDLTDASLHRASTAEVYAYRRHLKREALIAAGRALERAVAERDRLDPGPQLAEEDTAVVEARENVAALEALSPTSIPVSREKSVHLLPEEDSLLSLLGSPAHTAVEEDLDALIFGSVEDLNGFVEIEISMYGRFREEIVFSDTVIARPAAAYRATRELRDRVVAEVLGRPWANLAISTPDENASIYVDGKLEGIGEARLSRTEPGLRTVEVILPGGGRELRTVELAPFDDREIELAVEAPTAGTVTLRSSPEGADVYIGSRWRGLTPLAIPKPPEAVPYRLSLEGYNQAFGFIGPSSPDSVEQSLVPDLVDQAALVDERRAGFYQAFGAFVLSLPVPIVFNGLYQGVLSIFPADASDNPQLSRDENARLARRGTVYFYVSRGGMFISAGLFVNLAVQLGRYIDASQYKHDIPEE